MRTVIQPTSERTKKRMCNIQCMFVCHTDRQGNVYKRSCVCVHTTILGVCECVSVFSGVLKTPKHIDTHSPKATKKTEATTTRTSQ